MWGLFGIQMLNGQMAGAKKTGAVDPLLRMGHDDAEFRRAWKPETYVPIPRSTDSNEAQGTGITAKQRSAHFGNDSFDRVIAPAVAEVMPRRLKS